MGEVKALCYLVIAFFAMASAAQRRPPGFIYARTRGRCTPQYWSSRTELWPKMVRPRSTLSKIFGSRVFELRFESETTLIEAASSSINEGKDSECVYCRLARESTAALINSYARKGFPYTAWEVKTRVIAAMVSDKAADLQARKFLQANQNCG